MARSRAGHRWLAATGLAVLASTATGCATSAPERSASSPVVPATAITGLLLSHNEIRALAEGIPLVPEPVASVMDDNRNLLPNLNCLGVWHPGEAAIYGRQDEPGGWSSVRRQLLRTPGVEQWRSSVEQSVVTYPTVADARASFDQSSQRWSECVDHTVNITLNGRRMPRWLSGQLVRTPDRLTMPIGRTDRTQRSSCEHVLSIVVNVVVEVQACLPRTGEVTAAGEIATRIASGIPTAG